MVGNCGGKGIMYYLACSGRGDGERIVDVIQQLLADNIVYVL